MGLGPISPVTLNVSENDAATAMGLVAPVDTSYDASQLTITVDQVPTDGTVLIAGSDHAVVTAGETLNVTDLANLEYLPASNTFDASSSFVYTVADPDDSTSGSVTLNIGPAVGNPVAPSETVPVAFNTSGALSLPEPSDPNYDPSALTVTIVTLPNNGTLYSPDGTVITAGQTMSAAAFSSLEFATGQVAFGQSSDLVYAVTDPDGNASVGDVTLTVGPATGLPTAPSTTIPVTEDVSLCLGLLAPSDLNFAAQHLTVTLDDLPNNGTLTEADGTPVVAGASLTVDQFAALQFTPTAGLSRGSSSFDYQVVDAAGNAATGTVTLAIVPAMGNPVTAPAAVTVAEDAAATPIGIAAPTDPNFASSQLTITVGTLPTDGTVALADGDAVQTGEQLSSEQLTGLTFTPTAGLSGQGSAITYTVADPAGHQANGNAQLAVSQTDPVTGAVLPIITPGGNGGFEITAIGESLSGTNDGTTYAGPVSYLQKQFIWGGSGAIALRSDTPSVFIKGGTGDDALQVTGGNNVLDGGSGSNFLVGATGTDGGSDVFFVDARGSDVTWSTIVNFHPGDQLTLWGYQAGTSTQAWDAWSGAAGYEGVSLHSETNGAGTGINASVTFAGITQQTEASHFVSDTGSIGGLSYLHITYNA